MFKRSLSSNGFLGNLMAYGASEVASKLSRLFVVVAVARTLGVEEIGLAAAALAISEIIKSLTENGIGQRIMAAVDADRDGVCQTAHRLFWIWCLALFGLQVAIGGAVGLLSSPAVGWLIAVAALEYLFMPAGLVQAALAMREGKMKRTAAIAGVQIVSANVLSIVLAILFPSALVLVLPRVLTAPFWLVAMRRLRPWTPSKGVAFAPIKPFVTYGVSVLGVEIVKALRLHADKLVVGLLLGPEALGLYFMAFNAGLSLATSFVAAFGTVVFPHLCRSDDLATGTLRTAGLGVVVIAPVVLAQAYFAPVYVPYLLGPGWTQVAPVVSVLCLCALPLTVWTVVAARLRIQGRPQVEFLVTLGLTLGLTLGAIVAAPYGVLAMAQAYLLVTMAVLIPVSLPLIFTPAMPRLQEG